MAIEWRQPIVELIAAFCIAVLITAIFAAIVFSLLYGVDQAFDSALLDDLFELLHGSATPFLVVFSATTAGLIALRRIKSAHATVRLQETLDFIRSVELDREYIDAKKVWSRYTTGGTQQGRERRAAVIALSSALQIALDLEKSAATAEMTAEEARLLRDLAQALRDAAATQPDFWNKVHSDAQYLYTYLNHFEIVALGIERNIIDKDMYDDWLGGYVVQSWNRSAALVGALRRLKNSAALFEKWEALALDWAETRPNLTAAETPHYELADLGRLALTFYEDALDEAAQNATGV